MEGLQRQDDVGRVELGPVIGEVPLHVQQTEELAALDKLQHQVQVAVVLERLHLPHAEGAVDRPQQRLLIADVLLLPQQAQPHLRHLLHGVHHPRVLVLHDVHLPELAESDHPVDVQVLVLQCLHSRGLLLPLHFLRHYVLEAAEAVLEGQAREGQDLRAVARSEHAGPARLVLQQCALHKLVPCVQRHDVLRGPGLVELGHLALAFLQHVELPPGLPLLNDLLPLVVRLQVELAEEALQLLLAQQLHGGHGLQDLQVHLAVLQAGERRDQLHEAGVGHAEALGLVGRHRVVHAIFLLAENLPEAEAAVAREVRGFGLALEGLGAFHQTRLDDVELFRRGALRRDPVPSLELLQMDLADDLLELALRDFRQLGDLPQDRGDHLVVDDVLQELADGLELDVLQGEQGHRT